LLLRDGLLGELRLMVHPVILGGGKRLFEDEEDRKALKLVDAQTFATGVVYLTYRPADEGKGRLRHVWERNVTTTAPEGPELQRISP
jgi:hypothetical protein